MRVQAIITLSMMISSTYAGYYKFNIDSECKRHSAVGQCDLWKHSGDIDEKCFPAHVLIMTDDGPIRMDRVVHGKTKVMTSCGVQPVRAWLHRVMDFEVAYLTLHTDLDSITISDMHNIRYGGSNFMDLDEIAEATEFRFAAELKQGDYLVPLNNTIESATITNVTQSKHMGLYAPYTSCGDFYVSNTGHEFYMAHSFAYVRNTEFYNNMFKSLLNIAETVMPSVNEVTSRFYLNPLGYNLKWLFGDLILNHLPKTSESSRSISNGGGNDAEQIGEMIPIFTMSIVVVLHPMFETNVSVAV